MIPAEAHSDTEEVLRKLVADRVTFLNEHEVLQPDGSIGWQQWRDSAIVDPNAEVDPAFAQWNFEMKDGGAFAGVIAAENPTTITLKSLAGVQQVKVADLKKRENTGRSLMPEGFDGLGGEPLRDIIAFRNVLIHGYAAIEYGKVWRVIETSLPALRAAVATLLAELPPP